MGLVTRGRFLELSNLRDILEFSAIPTVVAAGMTAVIVAAEIDISVGAIVAVCAVIVASLARHGSSLPVLLAAGLVAGALLGSVNGLLTAGLRIPSIVTTLATMGAIRGLLVLVARGDTIPVPATLTDLAAIRVLGIPFLAVAAAVVATGVGLYLSRTRPGRQHYAVGSNPRAAQLSGLPVRWVTFRSFVLVGALTGLAGFLDAARFGPIRPTPRDGFELEVITAVVVGGTDIFGGEGTVLGSVLAVILLQIITIALPFAATFAPWLRSEIQPAVQGLLILVAVLYNSRTRGR